MKWETTCLAKEMRKFQRKISANLSQLSYRDYDPNLLGYVLLSSDDEWRDHWSTDLQKLNQMNWCHPHVLTGP